MNKLLIDWKLNKECNFNCTYCFKRDSELKCKNPSKNEIINALNVINKFKKDSIHILFSGGEPTLYENLDFFVDQTTNILKEKLYKITIISNCSIKNNFSSKLLNNKKVEIYYSIHSEYYSSKHTLEIIKKISKNTKLYIALMYNPNEKTKCRKIVDDIIKYKDDYTFDFKVVFIRKYPEFEFLDSSYNSDDFDYVNDINLKFKSSKNEFFNIEYTDHNILMQNNSLCLKNIYCGQGTEVLRIDEDGFCEGSICKYAKKSHFSIYKGISPYAIDFPSFVKCKANQCACKDNMIIKKFKEKDEMIGYINNENMLKNFK